MKRIHLLILFLSNFFVSRANIDFYWISGSRQEARLPNNYRHYERINTTPTIGNILHNSSLRGKRRYKKLALEVVAHYEKTKSFEKKEMWYASCKDTDNNIAYLFVVGRSKNLKAYIDNQHMNHGKKWEEITPTWSELHFYYLVKMCLLLLIVIIICFYLYPYFEEEEKPKDFWEIIFD